MARVQLIDRRKSCATVSGWRVQWEGGREEPHTPEVWQEESLGLEPI